MWFNIIHNNCPIITPIKPHKNLYETTIFSGFCDTWSFPIHVPPVIHVITSECLWFSIDHPAIGVPPWYPVGNLWKPPHLSIKISQRTRTLMKAAMLAVACRLLLHWRFTYGDEQPRGKARISWGYFLKKKHTYDCVIYIYIYLYIYIYIYLYIYIYIYIYNYIYI